MAEIGDKNGLIEWLTPQPRSIAVMIGARAALRSLPLIEYGEDYPLASERHALLLSCFRAIQVAFVYGAWPHNVSLHWEFARSSASYLAEKLPWSYNQREEMAAERIRLATESVHSEKFIWFAASAVADGSTALGWNETNLDIQFVEREQVHHGSGLKTCEQLASQRLWQTGIPVNLESSWRKLKGKLSKTDQEWGVWIDWYEARLSGSSPNELCEVETALIPDEEWRHPGNPAHINNIIQGLVQKHRPKPPSEPDPRPSPVHFEFRGGQLHRAPADEASPPQDRKAAAEQAWKAIREMLEDLKASDPGRNSPKLGRVLERCRSALGVKFSAIEIIALGVHAGRLDAYAAQADRILMEEDAADLVALNAQLGVFIGQFPEWSDYVTGLSEGFGSPEAESQAVDDASAVLDHIKAEAPETITDEALAELDALREAATPEPMADGEAVVPALSKRSFLRGMRDAIAKYCGEAVSSSRKGSLKGFEKSAETTVVVTIAGAGGVLLALATGLPAEFGWLSGMVTYIKRLLRKDAPQSPPPEDMMDA